MKNETNNKAEKQKSYLEVRMPMTCNETLCAGNDASYEIIKVNPTNGTSSYVSRFDVRQVYGRRPEIGRAFIVQENPAIAYGIFLVNRYDYSPGSELKTVGLRFTSKGAHKLAREIALKFTKKKAKAEGLSDVVNRINSDETNLRRSILEIHEQA
jgi:hypothetical protein